MPIQNLSMSAIPRRSPNLAECSGEGIRILFKEDGCFIGIEYFRAAQSLWRIYKATCPSPLEFIRGTGHILIASRHCSPTRKASTAIVAMRQRRNALHLDLILLVMLAGLAVWTEVDKLKRRHMIADNEKQTRHG